MIRLELNGKSWTLLSPTPLQLEADHVPRVGEIIDIGSAFPLAERTPTTFIVCDITWTHEDAKLIPLLKCQQWLQGDRAATLEQHGWLKG